MVVINSNCLIFDFDGIILESLDIKTEAFVDTFKEHGPRVCSLVRSHHMANGGVSRFEKIPFYLREYCKVEVNESRVSQYLEKFEENVGQRIIEASLVPGVLSFIKKYSQSYDLYISSGTPQVELNNILVNRGLQKYFVQAYGSPQTKFTHCDDIFARGYSKESSYFFGDAESDLRAAEYAGIKFVGRYTTWPGVTEADIVIKDFLDFNLE